MKKLTAFILALLLALAAVVGCEKDTPAVESMQKETSPNETVERETVERERVETDHAEPESTAFESDVQNLRPDGFDLSKALTTDTFKAKNSLKIPYSLYLPDGYSEEKDYPLLVYLYPKASEDIDSERSMAEASILFEHPSSPVFQSVLLIAQCPVASNSLWAIWENNTLDALNELTDHINASYSTDLNRQYYVGCGKGGDGVWQMAERFPERVTAMVSVGCQRIYVVKYDDGTYAPVGISEQMAEIPICIAYEKNAPQKGEFYCNAIRDELLAKGAEDVFMKEIDSKTADGLLSYTSEDDKSVLTWLFSKNRLTGEKMDNKKDKPQKGAVSTFFSAGDWFEYGEFTATNGITLPYRYYLPEDYDESREYPLLMYLHHNTAQGTDNETHVYSVNPYFANENSPVYDSIVILPQCPPGKWWSKDTIDSLAELLVFVNTQFSTDSARQYVTGVSMGGDGAWNLAEEYPHLVSAAVPVVGGGLSFYFNSDGTYTPSYVNPELLKVPIYYIYDTADEYMPEMHSRCTVRVMEDYGAEHFIYKETHIYGHRAGSMHVTVDDLSVLEWLFAQRRETACEK